MSQLRSKQNGAKGKEPSLIDQLSAPLRDFVADFKQHGKDAMEQVRKESPSKYLELATKLAGLVAALRPEPSGFSTAQSHADLGVQLLKAIGVQEDQITPDMVEEAVRANDTFHEQLEAIRDRAQAELN